MIKAVKLYLKDNTTIEVLFEDGITKSYDVLLLSKKFPQLLALKDRTLFLKGHLLGWGGVVWNDELDIEAETIYEDGNVVFNNDNVLSIVLGFKIKEERIKRGLTQEELSKKSGISQANISRLEKGKMNPSLFMIEKIARCLNKNFYFKFI